MSLHRAGRAHSAGIWQIGPVQAPSHWVERDATVVWHGFTQMSGYQEGLAIVVERAEGHYLVDVDGRRYLDAISSLWVNTLGHRVPELDQAIIDQLGRVAHTTMLGNGNRVVVELAEALARVVPVDRPHFLFASDGAAAVEQALKIAFQFWANQGSGRTSYLAFGDAYHGDTVGSLSLGAGGFGTGLFDPLRFPVLRAPSFGADPDLTQACAMVAEHQDQLAAVVVEPIVQGAGGIRIAPPASFRRLADACHRHDVLLIADEVATGFGRTGTLFACQQCEILPDLLCLGKGITGGYLPMSATVAAQRVFEAFLGPDGSDRTLAHGHSYGGNTLAAAVALRHLEMLEEWNVLDNVADRATQLRLRLVRAFATHPAVAEIRQHGLMCGIELAPTTGGLGWGRRVSAACVRRGVLIRPLGDVVVVMPPLSISEPEINVIVDTLSMAVDEVCRR
ncbi:MAG: adenosylmethionine--8-amino-7-oxononanoate transaminase [Actinomycetota bacterium]|nr:adenosylmethionine--8-amino-7-oxononanoate transaminase [Actinomycetota bacterium]